MQMFYVHSCAEFRACAGKSCMSRLALKNSNDATLHLVNFLTETNSSAKMLTRWSLASSGFLIASLCWGEISWEENFRHNWDINKKNQGLVAGLMSMDMAIRNEAFVVGVQFFSAGVRVLATDFRIFFIVVIIFLFLIVPNLVRATFLPYDIIEPWQLNHNLWASVIKAPIVDIFSNFLKFTLYMFKLF